MPRRRALDWDLCFQPYADSSGRLCCGLVLVWLDESDLDGWKTKIKTSIEYTGYSFLRSIAQLFTQIYTNCFFRFIKWTNWVSYGKFMDNCWISCQVMADMENFYDDLIIINLYVMLQRLNQWSLSSGIWLIAGWLV